MKILMLLPIVLVSISRVVLAAGDELGIPHITVYGTATNEVTPDQLHWALEVKNTGLELPKVAELHGKHVTAALETLKTNGIPEKDIQTAQMQFAENRVYRRNEWVKEGYVASTRIAFKMSDLTKYSLLWKSLAALSGVSVNGVSFDHSKRIELKKDTRAKALQAAKEKAVHMAEVLGAKVGEPLAVEEDALPRTWMGDNALLNVSASNVWQQEVAAEPDTGGVLAPGSIPITIRVGVTFRLLSETN